MSDAPSLPIAGQPHRLRALTSAQVRTGLWVFLGLLSLIPYAYARSLPNLRNQTIEFEYAFFAAFALYLVATVLVLRDDRPTSGRGQLILFGLSILFHILLIGTRPSLSDDMYRYVWDGRLQAHGISPYDVRPDAAQLASLRDWIWQAMNRRWAVTVYPPGAELAFAGLWRIWPDSVTWFQMVMAAGDILGGVALVGLLRALGRPASRALIYLWSPLLVFEAAHSAHVDGLVMPFLIGALLARAKGRDGWTGVLLGMATVIKLYPVLLLPALWRPRDEKGSWRSAWSLPLAFAGVVATAYVPYLLQHANVAGYLPNIVNERFNEGLSALLRPLLQRVGIQPDRGMAGLLLIVLAILSLVYVLRPARSAEQAIRRCIGPIAAFTLLTQYLLPWYVLWLLPLLALFLEAGPLGLSLDAWTGWLLFTGLVALAYIFFIKVQVVQWTIYAQFVPLYALLILPPAWRWGKKRLNRQLPGPLQQQSP